MTEKILPVCFLCGKEIKDSKSAEHIIPKQFYPSDFRKNASPTLLTRPAHKDCNTSYQSDEDYFFMSLAATAKDTAAGKLLDPDLKKRIKRPESKGLVQKVLQEFSPTLPSGISLPGDLLAKHFDNDRVYRVVWKMLKGLFFVRYNRFLPDTVRRRIILLDHVLPMDPQVKALFDLVKNTQEHSIYAGVLAYKFIPVAPDGPHHAWALLVWDRLIFLCLFHDPGCKCEDCFLKSN